MGETLYRKGGCADMEKRMEDEKIIQLIWDREERGLRELSDKYNNYCYSILSMMKRMPWSVLTIHGFGHGMPSRRNGRQYCPVFWQRLFEICR